MRRTLFFLFAIMILSTIHAAAGVHVDSRIAYRRQAGKRNAGDFTGSLRFTERPGPAEFAVLEGLGVQFFDYGNGRAGSRTVFPAKIPFAAVDELKDLDFLISIASARRRRMPPLSQSRPQVEADLAWQVSSPGGGTLSGNGVIVCDIDTGVNYLHSNFFKLSGEVFDWIDVDMSGTLTAGDAVDLDDDGTADAGEALLYQESAGTTTRGNNSLSYDTGFDYLYNDADDSGSRDYGPPAFGENDPCYGERLFLADDTNGNGTLDPGEALLALGSSKIRAIYNKDGSIHTRGVDLLTSEMDTWGHGSQVTGIMGGGWKGLHEMSGVAPGIETLHIDYDYAAEPPFLLPIAAGMAWAVGEGADVIIIEDGEWVWEYLDGSSNVEIMINEYAADDSVIFVVPAGNLAGGHMHTQFSSSSGEILHAAPSHTILWPSFIWTDATTFSNVSLTPPLGFPVALPLDGTTLIAGGYRIYSDISVSPRGTNRIDIRIATNPEGSSVTGDWAFSFTGPDTELHGYFGENTFSWASAGYWVNGESDYSTATWPSTADSAITVAAYTVTGDGDIDYYSGAGPRVDGTPIMDIAAPGFTTYSTSPWNPHDYSYFAGTSSAGPFVAGAAALLKELFPDLDNGMCRYYLRAGAGTDVYTTDPDRWGAGKLRIYSAISGALTDVAETPPHPELTMTAYPNPFNPSTTIRFNLPAAGPARIRIFDVAGREIWSDVLDPVEAGWQQVAWDGKSSEGKSVVSGIYFAHVRQGSLYAACKLIMMR